ncbi:MAG: PAS domain-containing protein [Pseudomonadota bacterium]
MRLVATPWHGASAILHTLRLLDSPPPSLHATDDTDRERARGRADVLDALPCSAILIDRRGAIQALNEAAANLCGFRPKELAGEPFTLLFDPASQTEAVRLLDAAVAGESSVRTLDGVLRARHRLGGGHEMRATIGAAQTARDLFCLMLQEPLPSPASGLDLPVQEGPFAASTNAGDDPAPSPALDPFARRVSHAVRVPLTPILGFVEMVRGAAFGPIGNGRYAKHAEAAAAAAAQLMASLQDIEALTAVPPAEAPARVSLASAIQSALDHVAPSAKRRRVLLRRDGADDAEAVFNADVLAQGLRVVLEEAVRATPQGGQVVISLTLPDEAGPDRSIAIRIRDGGPALSEQEIALALSAFRMARVSDRFSSSGRPFHMARLAALLEANGGTLNLRRGVEIGMLCEIRLPC